MLTALVDENELDLEWMELILEARKLGISDEEIREFLREFSTT
jgi:DNA-binding transcriptional MerR regulator